MCATAIAPVFTMWMNPRNLNVPGEQEYRNRGENPCAPQPGQV